MRPVKMTAAHKTDGLAELVCSNSLKSLVEHSAPGQLKTDMTKLSSLIIEAAYHARVPAGMALAVDRLAMSAFVRERLSAQPLFTLEVGEISHIPTEEELTERNERWIVASGPLTSDGLSESLQKLCEGSRRLHFYDAIAPVIEGDSIDRTIAFHASRYDKGGDEDYLNLPLNKEEYEAFVDAVIAAEKMPLHAFEETKYFEACLPIEVMIERGRETLRFGPMKPVGLTDPRTGRWPYAAVQLRKENVDGTMFSMVGFQTKMKWPDQKRVFSMIPGLAQAEFLRFGSVHRNTYVNSPEVLNGDLSFKRNARVHLAGQITGVEGYTESAAIGLLAGRFAAAKSSETTFNPPPAESVIGSLYAYITKGIKGDYAPMNANFGLLPGVERKRGQSKEEKKMLQCQMAREAFDQWFGN